jgi:putative ABC transport system permease protein
MTGPIGRRFPSWMMAGRNLSRSKRRSALAALGIVIGVVAIASLGMFGAALKFATEEQIGGIGSQVQVMPTTHEPPGPETEPPRLTRRQVQEIELAAGDTEYVLPVERSFIPISTGRESDRVYAYGVAEPDAATRAVSGRIPSPLRNGVLVGQSLASELNIETGTSLDVNGSTARVRATLVSRGPGVLFGVERGVVVPRSTIAGDGFDLVVVKAHSAQDANATAQAISEELNGRKKVVEVRDNSDISQRIDEQFQVVNTFLLGVGLISLLVAGISILNVMLMSAVERKEEIGVLRAVGFQRLDIVTVMVTEATLLGVAGALVGAGLSVGFGALIYDQLLGDPNQVFRAANAPFVARGVAFGVLTAVVSGLYPAWKASRAEPVDALRG